MSWPAECLVARRAGATRRGFPLILVLLLACGHAAVAQDARGRIRGLHETDFSLQPAFPNPFDRETRLPFILGEALFRKGHAVTVSMRVYNILHQLVAMPKLSGNDGKPGRRLDQVAFVRPGSYEAVWDGRDLQGKKLTPGPYFVQLLVDGEAQVRRLLLVR
ncbi:MAG: hypothetical protein ACE5HQ_01595 [Gemmatimonadota bacterium]